MCDSLKIAPSASVIVVIQAEKMLALSYAPVGQRKSLAQFTLLRASLTKCYLALLFKLIRFPTVDWEKLWLQAATT